LPNWHFGLPLDPKALRLRLARDMFQDVIGCQNGAHLPWCAPFKFRNETRIFPLEGPFAQFVMMATVPSRDSRGCRKSVIRIFLDFESALVASASDSISAVVDLGVFPFHGVAFQPPVRDDPNDNGIEIRLLYVDARGEGVF
jgi:hypothetical protein